MRGKNGQVLNNYSSGTTVNQGTISADVSGGTIQIGDGFGTFQNQGTLSALNGGTLNVYGPWINAAGANITAGAGSTLNLGSSTTNWSNAGTITATNATVNLGGSVHKPISARSIAPAGRSTSSVKSMATSRSPLRPAT